MQETDTDGIKRSGALAREYGTSYFENPHHFAPENWMELSSAWAAGWRREDKGRDATLKTLDGPRFW